MKHETKQRSWWPLIFVATGVAVLLAWTYIPSLITVSTADANEKACQSSVTVEGTVTQINDPTAKLGSQNHEIGIFSEDRYYYLKDGAGAVRVILKTGTQFPAVGQSIKLRGIVVCEPLTNGIVDRSLLELIRKN